MPSTAPFINIAAYKFISLDDIDLQYPAMLGLCRHLGLKGTILLSPEGINLFLAGSRTSIDAFLSWLRHDVRFADLEVKESYSNVQPFRHMLVKRKREIITMKHPLIQPEKGRAPAITAHTLKRWLDQGHDDTGRAVVMVDTRNDFEVDVGTFTGSLDYRIEKFSDFPEVIAKHQAELAHKAVITFCTGGIRCEKAAIHMQELGFKHVFQLEGGILKYFEDVGGAHYQGSCFVFDQRTALDPQLVPQPEVQCSVCQQMVSSRQQLSPLYIAGTSCPHCAPVEALSAAVSTAV